MHHRSHAYLLSRNQMLTVTDYRNGVNYIQTQLTTQPNGLTNDVRYWVYVVPI